MLCYNKIMIMGRFAPTPSGRMHLGNVYALLCAWAHARQNNGQIVLRIEDLDPLRCPRANADLIADDLRWLGLDWDKGAYLGKDSENYFQSNRTEIYQEFLTKLKQDKHIFPCFCSRGELHAADAPHLSDGRYRYPGTCRDLTSEQVAVKSFIRPSALRVRVDEVPLEFTDEHYGYHKYVLEEDCGDFIVRRSDGVFAYHLAVVVDDALMGVTEVVRGRDLIDSVPVQMYLYKLLGFQPPRYCHIPLLTAADGRRLAKRDRDLDLGILRQKYKAAELIGLLAYKMGLTDKKESLTAREFLTVFDVAKLPKEDIVLKKEDIF